MTSENVGICFFDWGGSEGVLPRIAGGMSTHPRRPQICHWEINEN